MTLEWVVIETLAVLVENIAKIHFISSQLHNKYISSFPIILMGIIQIGWGLFATFASINQTIYVVVAYALLLACVCFAKLGAFLRKLFAVILTMAISFSTSLVGAGLSSLMLGRTISHSISNQDTSRLLAIVFIKMIQFVVYFTLAKKPKLKLDISRTPVLVLVVNTILCFVLELFLWFYATSDSLAQENSYMIIAMSVCPFLILIGGFVMYGLFAKLEQRNIELSAKLQRSEIETTFQDEIKNMHTDLQKWRHEYRNNLIAIRGHVESGNMDAALEHIDQIAGAPLLGKPMVLTNNLALDAVVNSKLWMADARGINVSAQSAFPEDGVIRVSDGDLCSITGNLLDNSIEACARMKAGERKFLTLEILVKGDNLFLTIYNSYSGEIRRDGENYISSKGKPYNGFGIKYVDSIINKYEGYAMRNYKNGVFATQIMIPLLDPDGGYLRAERRRGIYKFLDRRRHHTGK